MRSRPTPRATSQYPPVKQPLTLRTCCGSSRADHRRSGCSLKSIRRFAIKFFGIFISVGGYALIWGWRFAVGFVLLILVHELGHYLEAKRQGLHPSLPVFIPFLGAYVAIKDAPFDPGGTCSSRSRGRFLGGAAALGVWSRRGDRLAAPASRSRTRLLPQPLQPRSRSAARRRVHAGAP